MDVLLSVYYKNDPDMDYEEEFEAEDFEEVKEYVKEMDDFDKIDHYVIVSYDTHEKYDSANDR